MPFLPRNPEHHTADVIALHRATLEHPLDDTPHLVYADAMDDAGAHEEAHTLRRLVKLRAAVGTRATRLANMGEPVTALKGKLLATNIVEAHRGHVSMERDGPHIYLPDAVTGRTGGTRMWERDRTVRINRVSNGGIVTFRTDADYHERGHDEPRTATSTHGYSRAFLHSDTVKHLLGEHDAQ